MTTEAPRDDLVVADKKRALRWEDQARWVALETQVSDLKASLKTEADCVAVTVSVDQVLARLDFEKEFYSKNCLPEKAQLRSCLASHLRFDEMSSAVDRLKRDVAICVREDGLRPITSRTHGQVGAGFSDRHYSFIDSTAVSAPGIKKSSNDFNTFVQAGVAAEKLLVSSLAMRSKIDSYVALEKSSIIGRQYLDLGVFYASNEAVFDLGFSLANERGFFDLPRENTVSENRYGLQSSARLRLDDRDFEMSYQPIVINGTGRVYNGVRHEISLDLSGERVERSVGYHLSYIFFRAASGTLFPDWSATRFALDLSNLFTAGSPDSRNLRFGVEERRDANRVARIYPYFDFRQSFGPFDGAAWLTGPLSFAQEFESSLHLRLQSEESRLTPSNQVADVEGELVMKGPRVKVPLRLGVRWLRALFGESLPKNENYLMHVGLYPEFRVSGRFYVELQAEFNRSLLYNKINPDPRLWIFPYESYNQFFAGVKTRYDF